MYKFVRVADIHNKWFYLALSEITYIKPCDQDLHKQLGFTAYKVGVRSYINPNGFYYMSHETYKKLETIG